MSNPQEPKLYKVSISGVNLGPFDEQQLHEMVSNGAFPPSSSVWTEGMEQWQPYDQVFASVAQPSPPDMPPVPDAASVPGMPPLPDDNSVLQYAKRVGAAAQSAFKKAKEDYKQRRMASQPENCSPDAGGNQRRSGGFMLFNWEWTEISFRGRITRRRYWTAFLSWLLVVLPLNIIQVVFQLVNHRGALTIVFLILYLLVFLPIYLYNSVCGLSLAVRRMHDIDKSWKALLISLIPIVGWIIMIVWLCRNSSPYTNMYGENPKPEELKKRGHKLCPACNGMGRDAYGVSCMVCMGRGYELPGPRFSQPQGYGAPAGMPGYPPQQGYGAPAGMPGYPPQQSYGAPAGMPGYPPQQGYGAPAGMPGYPPQQGYGAPAGMPGYSPQQGYGAPAGMPGYPPQQGYGAPAGMPGYPQQQGGEAPAGMPDYPQQPQNKIPPQGGNPAEETGQ